MIIMIVGTLLYILKSIHLYFYSERSFEISFKTLPLSSLLAGFMGAGAMGLICQYEFKFNSLLSFFLALLLGGVFIFIQQWLNYAYKIPHRFEFSYTDLVGAYGKVVSEIPPDGHGQVEIVYSHRRMLLKAHSQKAKIEKNTPIKVVAINDDSMVIVERRDA